MEYWAERLATERSMRDRARRRRENRSTARSIIYWLGLGGLMAGAYMVDHRLGGLVGVALLGLHAVREKGVI